MIIASRGYAFGRGGSSIPNGFESGALKADARLASTSTLVIDTTGDRVEHVNGRCGLKTAIKSRRRRGQKWVDLRRSRAAGRRPAAFGQTQTLDATTQLNLAHAATPHLVA
ncbi:hypothetical protein BvRS1_49400 [Burkholderia vietnamiensis]|nr:hypothetical protein BvRS1_49400 [Burkholderia vietnamiensis]